MRLLEAYDFAENLVGDNDGYFVYQLINGGVVVYVVQTSNINGRIVNHLKSKKDFDSVRLIECEKHEANEIESNLIISYMPIYNKSLPKNKRYITDFYFRSILMQAVNEVLDDMHPDYENRVNRWFCKDRIASLADAIKQLKGLA